MGLQHKVSKRWFESQVLLWRDDAGSQGAIPSDSLPTANSNNYSDCPPGAFMLQSGLVYQQDSFPTDEYLGMKISCPYCSRSIPAEDVNLATSLAKCTGCDHVFSFAEHLSPAKAPEKSAAVPLPPKFNVEDLGTELTIRWSWYSHAVWFLFFFCIVWDGFLVFWYAMALGSFRAMGWFSLLPLLFPLLHVAVGIGLTYSVLATFFNRTIIRIAQGELSISHGPIPWLGNHRLSTFEIQQFYCTEKITNGRRRYSVSYDLNLMRADNTKLQLLNLEELDQALYLEQKLEEFLRIADEKIPGEVQK